MIYEEKNKTNMIMRNRDLKKQLFVWKIDMITRRKHEIRKKKKW